MTLLLLRHGETPLNVARVLQPPDTPLSATGRAQAAALGARMAGMGLAGIVSSDLPRAWQTAEAVAAASGLPIQSSPLLQERNFGAWRGQAYDTLGFDPLTTDDEPPGGESLATFHVRVARAFDWLLTLRSRSDGPLAVVTHGLVIRAMLERHVQRAADQPLPPRIANTSVSSVDADAPHRARLIDCTAHLRDHDADKAQALSGG